MVSALFRAGPPLAEVRGLAGDKVAGVHPMSAMSRRRSAVISARKPSFDHSR
jgi:hypothetical protein